MRKMLSDAKFPWINFPKNPEVGQKWKVMSKVMPVWTTWQFQGAPIGWVAIECA